MRPPLMTATVLLALALAPAMAKPTATQVAWNLRAALAPQVDLRIMHQAPQPRLAPDLPATARAGEHRLRAQPLS